MAREAARVGEAVAYGGYAGKLAGVAVERLQVGDRVALCGAETSGKGTITQVLEGGIVRVLWDRSEMDSLHLGGKLTKLSRR